MWQPTGCWKKHLSTEPNGTEFGAVDVVDSTILRNASTEHIEWLLEREAWWTL